MWAHAIIPLCWTYVPLYLGLDLRIWLNAWLSLQTTGSVQKPHTCRVSGHPKTHGKTVLREDRDWQGRRGTERRMSGRVSLVSLKKRTWEVLVIPDKLPHQHTQRLWEEGKGKGLNPGSLPSLPFLVRNVLLFMSRRRCSQLAEESKHKWLSFFPPFHTQQP